MEELGNATTPNETKDQASQNQEPIGSTEIFVGVKEIKNGTIFLKGGGMRKIIMTSGVNLDLKTEDEQSGTFSQFQNLLNSLDFSVQLLVHSRRMAIKEYLEKMKKRAEQEEHPLVYTQFMEYISFVEHFVAENAVMEKTFFVSVPFDTGPISLDNGVPGIKKSAHNKEGQQEISSSDYLKYAEKINHRTEQILQGLNQIGLRAVTLGDAELKEFIRNFYNPRSVENVLTNTNEPIAPKKVELFDDYIKVNDKFIKTFYISNYPKFLSTGWLEGLVNSPDIFDISIQFSPVDTTIALKNLTKKVGQLTAAINERQEKGLIRDPALETAIQDTENLRDTLQQSREKLFSIGLYITIYADTLDELKTFESRISTFFTRMLASAQAPMFEQIPAFNSVIPLVKDEINSTTTLNTSPACTFFPFISPDLTSDEGIIYGLNIHNNSLVIFDRFKLENHNSVIFARSGSGKSYTAKLEVLRSMMMGCDILIIDPENEYQTLSESVSGSSIKISLTSKDSINPFDIPPVPEGEDENEVLRSHIANLAGLIKVMVGAISPAEEAILDRALNETYAARDIAPGRDYSKATPPLLQDLETVLENMEGGKNIADRLYRFTKGSYAGFINRQSSVNVDNRLVVFSIRDLEEELRPIAMYMILNYVWNITRSKLKKRILVVDEAWLMMKYPESAAFLFNLVRRARKYYLGITTITQDVEDFLKSEYGRPVITNSALQLLLKQSSATIDTVAKAFNLTSVEKNYLVEASVGQGLIIVGTKHVGAQIVASPFEHSIITTKPEEVLARREALEQMAEENKENREKEK